MIEIVHKCRRPKRFFADSIKISSDDGCRKWYVEGDAVIGTFMMKIKFCPYCGKELKAVQ